MIFIFCFREAGILFVRRLMMSLFFESLRSNKKKIAENLSVLHIVTFKSYDSASSGQPLAAIRVNEKLFSFPTLNILKCIDLIHLLECPTSH